MKGRILEALDFALFPLVIVVGFPVLLLAHVAAGVLRAVRETAAAARAFRPGQRYTPAERARRLGLGGFRDPVVGRNVRVVRGGRS